MSRYPLPDSSKVYNGQRRYNWRGLRVLSLALVLGAVPAMEANASGAQRAIESLEGCSAEERSSGCVKILKRKSLGGKRQAIKAQVRGGRIIWYEYDGATGSVRRTN